MRISDWSSDVCSSDLQFLLARGLALGIAQLVLRGGQFGLALPVIGAQRGDARARAGDRGFGLVDGGLIRRRIDPEQHVAFLHPLRSEERRVGKECVSTFSSRWSLYH